MRVLCEVVVTEILPTLRALITSDLMRTYGFNQVEVSQLLSITQPAVSQYRRGLRGTNARKLESNKTIMSFIQKLTSEISLKKLTPLQVNEEIAKISDFVAREKIFGEVAPCLCHGEEHA
jgi:predicted transcriptional regulator